MRENEYQVVLINKLREMFPGCFILKNDSDYIQGIPDLLILWFDRWAMLEVKASADSPERPNQSYYVTRLNDLSFAEFIYPENEAEVLRALQYALTLGRPTRVSQR